jgi:hypothetical protein
LLSRPYSLLPDGFTSLHLPSGVLFSFHSRYYFAIGFWECLGFGVHAPGLPAEFPIRRTLCSGITLVSPLRDYHPLRCPVPRDFMLRRSGGPGPHIPTRFHARVRLALFRFRSPLLTESRLISFPLPTKMLQFGRLPFAQSECPQGAGGPIRQSPVHRLLAPTRGNIAAWHDLHRLQNRAIPHLVCSNTTEVELRLLKLTSAFCLVQAAYARQ